MKAHAIDEGGAEFQKQKASPSRVVGAKGDTSSIVNNHGQLKNMAKAAVAELDAWLPGGAGGAVHALLEGWSTPSAATNDYAAVNVGQLKAVAKPFYDRLIAASYTGGYPWAGKEAQANDYALANIGQVKNLFSFDLAATDAAHDSDGNGLPDWWEISYLDGRTGVDPYADEDEDGISNLEEFLQRTNPQGFELFHEEAYSGTKNQEYPASTPDPWFFQTVSFDEIPDLWKGAGARKFIVFTGETDPAHSGYFPYPDWLVDDYAAINGHEFVRLGNITGPKPQGSSKSCEITQYWNNSGGNTLSAVSDQHPEAFLADFKLVAAVPVDMDIVHPATGEMAESRERSEGGYIALRKDEETPVTKLKLHKLDGVSSAQFKLVFGSAKIKLWKDAGRTQAVTSDQTTFPANVDTELFFEGVEKSARAKDVEIALKVIIGLMESSAVTTKATVVQEEFPINVIAFIPYRWVNVPMSWLLPPFLISQVADGDKRGYDPTLSGSFRAKETVQATPFRDLSSRPAKSNIASDGLSIHYAKTQSVPASEQSSSHGAAYTENRVETARGQGTHSGPVMDNVALTSTQKISFDIHMLAYEGVLGGFALPVGWDLRFTFDMTNPAEPNVNLTGSRTGFPGFEIYVGNATQENLPLYQWTPPSDRTVWSLGVIEAVTIPQPLPVP